MKLLLCLVLFSVAAAVTAQEDYAFPDYWGNEFDNYDDFSNEGVDSSYENTDLKTPDTKAPSDTEIQDVKEQIEPQNEPEGKEFDVMEDYQIEDNRSNSDEKEQTRSDKEAVATDEPVPDAKETEQDNIDELAVAPLEESNKSEATTEDGKDLDADDGAWFDVAEDDVAPLPVPSTENNQDIFEETKNILNEDTQNFDGQQADEESVKEDNPELVEEQAALDKILEENNNAFEANDYDNSEEQQQDKSEEDLFSENKDESEDTPAKVYADLNADLDKLFETLDKLSDDNSEEDNESDTDSEYVDNIQDYEEKYNKPYHEDIALSWRNAEADNDAEKFETSDEQEDLDDYENLDDSNFSDIFAEHAEANSTDSNEFKESNVTKTQELNEADENGNNAEKITKTLDDQTETVVETTTEKDIEPNETLDNVEQRDEFDQILDKVLSEEIKEAQPYGDDALVDEKQPQNEDAEEFESIESNGTRAIDDIEQTTVMVDDLSSAELSDLMTQFAIAHSEDLDVHSESFAKHVAPIHVTLSVDEPTVITSPDYPNNYPTNNIVDWIFDGPGTGIEMNITDFAVNGALGDYLLVKPGGLDASGNDGLIFSYRLTSERRYRFADVNRMFVRFEAKPGWAFMTGFRFTVKMMWPLAKLADELPQPEPVLNPPNGTLTLNLAGLTLPKFVEIKEQFRELIADMAKAYIRDNDIDQGLNTTFEVTQITKAAVCNIQWPEYETCVEVTFGVPLHYEEESESRLSAQDLDTMWTSYVIKEEFASRLRSLGITEYAIPNDRTVLMVWLVIAFGVLISMAMLAFALWRFSCFEDYTRMKAYGDTDSIQNEKRHLDLYPTPHQTLPPLYSENDYKWADDKYDDSTRVDMGGFSNRSYVRDELFDLDSDEDVITTRDKKGAISPRELFAV